MHVGIVNHVDVHDTEKSTAGESDKVSSTQWNFGNYQLENGKRSILEQCHIILLREFNECEGSDYLFFFYCRNDQF